MPFPPACSVRETAAFLWDPAAFSAGPGLALGDAYRVRIPGRRLFVVTDPELIEAILVRSADHFEKSHIYWRQLQRTMGESMGSLDGERWRYLNRIQMPFFTPRAVCGYMPEVGARISEHWGAVAERSKAVGEVSVLDVLAELNTRVVLSVLFGRDHEPASTEIARRIADGHRIVAWLGKYPWRPATAWLSGVDHRVSEHRKFFGDYVERLRSACRAPGTGQLLDALVGITGDPAAPRFEASLLRNEVVFHLGASTETLAAAEGWTLYLLAGHPDVLERLRREIADVAGQRWISFEHVESLTLTKQVVLEALRLYPPVYGVVRDCVRSVDLGRLEARAGDTFLVSIYGLHRSPRHWEEPETFRPDRFGSAGAPAIGKHQYLPFGAGKHACIGRHLALSAMVLTVGQVAQRFDWTFTDPDVRAEARPSLKPSGRFRAILTRRT